MNGWVGLKAVLRIAYSNQKVFGTSKVSDDMDWLVQTCKTDLKIEKLQLCYSYNACAPHYKWKICNMNQYKLKIHPSEMET